MRRFVEMKKLNGERMSYQKLDLSNKSALITGASSGIGLACAQMLGALGVKLKLVARRRPPMESMISKYQGEFLQGDINNSDDLKTMAERGFFNCDILINNAGLALGKECLSEVEDSDIDIVFQTNVISALKITKRCLKFMKSQKLGDIVNICSIASHESYKGGSVYCASKYALRAMGEALRHDTLGENIRIINVSPGMVETEFSLVRFRGSEELAALAYQGMKPLVAEDIAWQIVSALESPRHVNIDEIKILSLHQAGATNVFREL